MRTISVTAPDGTEWDVRVAWQPRWPLLVRRFGGWRVKRREKKKGTDRDPFDALDKAVDVAVDMTPSAPSRGGGGGGGGFDLGDDLVLGLLILVGLVVFGFAFWFLLLPLLLVVLDIFVLLLLFLLATAARVLLGRPWTVEAVATSSPTRRRRTTRRSRSRSADGEPRTITTLVRGWRNALRTRDRLAEALLQGAPTDSPVSESA